MNTNKPKTDKNEHEIGKRSKSEAGEAKRQKKAQNVIRSPQRITKLHKWSLGKVWKKWQFQSLIFQEITKVVL